jgi:hypothetical protein
MMTCSSSAVVTNIEVDGREGFEFIEGSIEGGEFRFSQIREWIRQHIKQLPSHTRRSSYRASKNTPAATNIAASHR